MAIGFSTDTRYVRKSRSGRKVTAPCRLYLKQYTNKEGKTSDYWEGAVKLSNGQYAWFSIGASGVQHEKNGKVYMNANVSLTSGSTASGGNSFIPR